ncbi:hypothetical protein, partial [Vibrio parahaemolyticus]|uniref:hypothetical protein n=1 Tax=Vibrio parahaemolyticus TaxID=670 RepID=UPI001E4EE383
GHEFEPRVSLQIDKPSFLAGLFVFVVSQQLQKVSPTLAKQINANSRLSGKPVLLNAHPHYSTSTIDDFVRCISTEQDKFTSIR